MTERKYTILCAEDGQFETGWLLDAPTECPNDANHTMHLVKATTFHASPYEKHFALLRYPWSDTGTTVSIGAMNTYYKLTNWSTIKTNGMTHNAGDVAVIEAGYYHLDLTICSETEGPAQQISFGLHINDVLVNEIRHEFDKKKRIVTFGMTAYLPAGAVLSMHIANKTSITDFTYFGASITCELVFT